MTRIVTILLLAAIVTLSGCQFFQDLGDKVTGKSKGEMTVAEESEKAALQKQIDKKFENPVAHYKLGALYHADGLYDKAEYEYRTALGFDPVYYKAQAAIVKVLQDRGEAPRSKMSADIYMTQAAVSAEASMLLGKGFQQQQLDEYALKCYQQAQTLAPNSAVLFKQIGYYYLAKGDQVRAEENLRRSFQLDPYQSEVAGELGRMGVMVQIPREPKKDKGNWLDRLWKKEEAKDQQE